MINLDFLLEDLERQRKIAQKAIEEAKKLEASSTETDPAILKRKLEEAKQALLEVATGLQSNATQTSSSVRMTILKR